MEKREANVNNVQSRKVFIGGLNYNTTEDGLKKHFGIFGNIVDVVVVKFPDTKRSRGFGFVTYDSVSAVDACQEARPHVIDGKEVETKRATPKEEFGQMPEAGQAVKKVFVGGLKEDVEDQDLREYFSQFGTVTAVTRLTEKDTGKKRGFGFVEFDDYDPVDKTLQKGHRHLIKGYKVDVKKAMSRKDITSMGGPKALKAANFFSGRGNRRSYGGGFDSWAGGWGSWGQNFGGAGGGFEYYGGGFGRGSGGGPFRAAGGGGGGFHCMWGRQRSGPGPGPGSRRVGKNVLTYI